MRLGRSFGILAILLLMAPSISHARQNEPPRKCIVNGRIDCSRKGCARYCNNVNVTWPVAPPAVRPVPPVAPPPAVRPVPPVAPPPAVRPVPPVAPPPVVRPVPPVVRPVPPVAPPPVVRPVPPVVRPLQEINRDINRLERENDRLQVKLERERAKAESEYEVCRRYIPVYLTNYCVYDDSKIRAIQAEIKENKRMLRALKEEKSRW